MYRVKGHLVIQQPPVHKYNPVCTDKILSSMARSGINCLMVGC